MAYKPYDFFKLTEAEQAEFLGHDIGEPGTKGYLGLVSATVVELDEVSMRRFYNRRYALLEVYLLGGEFRVYVRSIDDASVNELFYVDVEDMPSSMYGRGRLLDCSPSLAIEKLAGWLKRSGYFVNLAGLESFCSVLWKRG